MRPRTAITAAVSLVGLLASAGLAQALAPAGHSQEFRASTFSLSAQEDAALGVAPDGSFTVVWSSRRQQEGKYGVYMQRFDHRGVAVGEETPLHLWTKSHAMKPVIDYAPDGSAWAAWQSSGQDGSGNAVIARRFDAQGQGGSERLVNESTEGDQLNPVLAALPDGGAAVAWTTLTEGGVERVAVRVFETDGSARIGEIVIDPTDGVRTATPSVVCRPDGSFAVAYTTSDAETGELLGVRVQSFTATGESAGQAVQVSAPGSVTPVEPVLEATDDGYVIAWQDVVEHTHNYDVLAQRLDSDCRPIGQPVVVNSTRAGLQNAAAIAVSPSGSLTIAFNGRDDHGVGVFAREFSADLSPVGAEYRLTGRVRGDQAMREAVGTRRLGFTPDGTLICAWQGDAGFGDSSAASVTMHSPRPFDLGLQTAGVVPHMAPALHGETVVTAGGPGPHEPPTFDARDIDDAEREIITTRGGIGFTAVVNTGWTPPDPHMAVGPRHVVVMTNGQIAFFTKDGTRTFVDEIEDSFGFWGSEGASGFVFDPEVVYDETTGRFIAMAAEAFAPGNRSYCLVAVSDDSDPNGTWYKYRLDTTTFAGDLFDSPNIGVTDNALVITGDGFGFGANYPVYIYEKAPFLSGAAPVLANSFTLATSTQSAGFPRVTTGTGDTLYLLEHREAFSNNSAIRVLAFTDILGSIQTSAFNLSVPLYGAPEDPPQAGTSSRPNTFDARFWSVDQGPDGHIWGTHHINSDRVLARWYEVDMQGWPDSGNSPALVQSGDIDLGAGIRTFFSAINVSGNGNAAITYSRSSPSEFLSMGTAWRRACDALGTMPNDDIHKVATAGYSAGRWGDYSAIEFDPIDDNLYWAHHEWAEGSSWRTWVQAVVTEGCTCAGDFNGDGTTNTQDVLLFLNAWNAGDTQADCDGDGSITTLDVLCFLNVWNDCRP